MSRAEVAYVGRTKRVLWARAGNGRLPAKEFFDQLGPKDRARFQVLFERMGDHGEIRNREKFVHEADQIYAFKIFKQRLACFFDTSDVVMTHGYEKKRDRVPPAELDRARRIRDEYRKAQG